MSAFQINEPAAGNDLVELHGEDRKPCQDQMDTDWTADFRPTRPCAGIARLLEFIDRFSTSLLPFQRPFFTS
jgi:hypothetical protein